MQASVIRISPGGWFPPQNRFINMTLNHRIINVPFFLGWTARQHEGGNVSNVTCPSQLSRGSASHIQNSVDINYDELNRLRAQVVHHDQLYHSQGAPEISDDAYDALKARLKLMESVTPASSSSHPAPVGSYPTPSALTKIKHMVPMLSLLSVKSVQEVNEWHRKLLTKLPADWSLGGTSGQILSWMVEPKVDGLALSLLYRDGRLVQAATRGDGATGENVTHNASVIKGIPLAMEAAGSKEVQGILEVRGEVYMLREDLEKVNQEQVSSGLSTFANTRNAAAGSLRLLDPATCAARRLSFFAYQLLTQPLPNIEIEGLEASSHEGSLAAFPVGIQTQSGCLDWLSSQGFATSSDNLLCTDGLENALKAAQEWMEGRNALGYEVDGVVLKLNELRLQSLLGHSGADPEWAIALKFPAQEAFTKLTGLSVNVGRSGQVIPVAELEPVSINGVSISRATLHNIGVVQSLDVRVGDTVLVKRAGDVIPQVVMPMVEMRTGTEVPWQAPACCPCCGQGLVIEGGKGDNALSLWCKNPVCGGQSAQLILHFAKTCLVGSNLGIGIVTQLMEAGLLTSIVDFFTLTEEKLLTLPNFGQKRAAQVVTGIASAAEHMTCATLLAGLGVPTVGHKTSKDLERAFDGNFQRVQSASLEQLTTIPGIGPKTAASLISWFQNPANMEMLRHLELCGLSCMSPLKARSSKGTRESISSKRTSLDSSSTSVTGLIGERNAQYREEMRSEELPDEICSLSGLEGKTFVMTGSLSVRTLSRKQFSDLLSAHGAALIDTVTTKVDAVLFGEKPGKSKIEKAKKCGVALMSEKEFWDTYGRDG
ncbi:hypothetical protein CEUSTIGMA_g5509.t1 [Chlamydomonas eustigma]|uniref:DNA ligase (NAD(+)) n=1 Tax=Chlamydomonas eustigma TaxID=1157962 RepID=A0A250X4Q0_9CHLO|nr:hypothetical protein CEUSTIGMA_g5509.t1 [Chlamydomonas eustigma]|eukprot:GAX78067.1 hypothetical protein CEUSTIGMA_g5509.t1 [Chlamydomonas eustigma]